MKKNTLRISASGRKEDAINILFKTVCAEIVFVLGSEHLERTNDCDTLHHVNPDEEHIVDCLRTYNYPHEASRLGSLTGVKSSDPGNFSAIW